MHYLKLETILRLALAFQGTREGLSLADIQQDFDVGRRTAERMRDAVARVFPQFERCDQGERIRRWRLPQGTLGGLVALGADELAAIEAAAAEWRARGLEERAGPLDAAAAKLRAMARPEHLRRVEPDLEVLMEAEGSALRPGPRPQLADGITALLRRGILACLPLSMDYRSRNAAQATRITVHPYGLLYGSRPLLVAAPEPWNEPRLYRLDRMDGLELGNIPFLRRAGFALQDYAARAFGTFQEEPFDVVLRFPADTADEAAQWLFHPTQETERDGQGRLLVHFHAGGAQEMCWHIFTWGTSVEIVSPDGLRTQLQEMLAAALRHHA